MADRYEIRDYILQKLEDIGQFMTVKYGTFEPRREKRPVAAFIPDVDQRELASKTHSTRDLDGVIRVSVDEGSQSAGFELDELLKVVGATFDSDKRLGGLLTLDLREGATRWLYNDERWPQAGADIEYKFHYQV